jgi:hypothetical protein
MAAPLNTCTTIEQRGVVRFCGQKIWKQRISTTKKCYHHASTVKPEAATAVAIAPGGQEDAQNMLSCI